MTNSLIAGGDTKEFVQTAVTVGGRPADIVQQLDSIGIDWHLTESGDLMVRTWEVVAENFVPKEQVAEIQGSRTPPRQASELEWLSRNLPELETKYAGEWIAVVSGEVVGAATDLPSLLQMIGERGVDDPFITKIPSEPVIWATAYYAG